LGLWGYEWGWGGEDLTFQGGELSWKLEYLACEHEDWDSECGDLAYGNENGTVKGKNWPGKYEILPLKLEIGFM
jgi:hypothetical protein